MAQLIVTVEDYSLLPMIKKAIGLLRGVKEVTVKKEEKVKKSSINRSIFKQGVHSGDIPSDIQSLIGIASGISQKDIMSDDRLSYLLSK